MMARLERTESMRDAPERFDLRPPLLTSCDRHIHLLGHTV